MTPFPPPETAHLTRAIAAAGLVGAPADPFPTRPLDAGAWRNLVTSVQLNRVTGLLAAVVHDARLPSTAAQRDEVMQLHAEMMGICLRLESDLLEVTALLESAGVQTIVLKGPSFAHLDYERPDLRFFGDIDLLVRGEHFDSASDTLVASGFQRRFREVRPRFDGRFGKGASFTGASGREVDVHRTFVMGPFGLQIQLGPLWDAGGQHFQLAGRRLRALDHEGRFLHACYHAALGKQEPQLVPLRDLAGMLERASDLDAERWVRRATSWNGLSVIARAVATAWSTLALSPTALSVWARSYRPTASERRALRTYLDPRMGYAARSVVALSVVPGLSNKLAFGYAMLVPDSEFGSGRHGGRMKRIAHAGREVAVLVRGPR